MDAFSRHKQEYILIRVMTLCMHESDEGAQKLNTDRLKKRAETVHHLMAHISLSKEDIFNTPPHHQQSILSIEGSDTLPILVVLKREPAQQLVPTEELISSAVQKTHLQEIEKDQTTTLNGEDH